MPAVTPDDRRAGFKNIYVSTCDGRILPVRVQPMPTGELFRLLDGQVQTRLDVLSKVTDADCDFLGRLKSICYPELLAVSMALAGFDDGTMQPQISAAKQIVGQVAPDQL